MLTRRRTGHVTGFWWIFGLAWRRARRRWCFTQMPPDGVACRPPPHVVLSLSEPPSLAHAAHRLKASSAPGMEMSGVQVNPTFSSMELQLLVDVSAAACVGAWRSTPAWGRALSRRGAVISRAEEGRTGGPGSPALVTLPGLLPSRAGVGAGSTHAAHHPPRARRHCYQGRPAEVASRDDHRIASQLRGPRPRRAVAQLEIAYWSAGPALLSPLLTPPQREPRVPGPLAAPPPREGHVHHHVFEPCLHN